METPGRGTPIRGVAAWSLIVSKFAHAWDGLRYVYRTQRNMRFHVLAGTLVGGACIGLGLDRLEILMVVLAVAGVLLAEVVNTVAEALADLIEPRLNPIAKVVKDVAAAGVLLGALFSVIIAVLVFGPIVSTVPERLREFIDKNLLIGVIYLLCAVAPAAIGAALPLRALFRTKLTEGKEPDECCTRPGA